MKNFINFLPPWVETNIQPAFYDKESGTVLQQTARMYAKVNQLVRKFNELEESFSNIENYFDNLDVQEEINNKLDKMAEDGTLQEIVGEFLDPFIDKFNTFADTFTQTALKGEYLVTRYKEAGTATSFDPTIPHEMEGICHVGNNKVVVFYSPRGQEVTENTDCLIEELDLSTAEASVNRQSTISGLMHCNSCCFNPTTNKIYVTPSQYYDTDHYEYVNTVVVLNYNNFSIDSTVTFSSLTNLSKIAFDDEKFYCISSNAIYELDMTNATASKLFDLNTKYSSGSQGLEVKDGKFYVMSCYPHLVTVYSSEGVIEKVINIDDYDSWGHASEWFADITFDADDNLLLTPHCTGDYIDYSFNKFSLYINYITRINLNGNIISTPIDSFLRTAHEYFADTTGSIEAVTRATGSQAYPMKSIQEVLRNYYYNLLGLRIVGTNHFTYRGTIILDNQSLNTDNNITCEGVKMRNSEIGCGQLICNSKLIDVQKSTIRADKMYLRYSGDEYHVIRNSTIEVPEVYSTGTSTPKIELSACHIIKYNNTYKSKKQSPLDVIQSSISVSGNTLTADFSNYISDTAFNPNAYILGLNLNDPGESITYLRCQGLGNNRAIKDSAGNSYTFTTYNASTKSVTITGSNVSHITVVSMVVL